MREPGNVPGPKSDAANSLRLVNLVASTRVAQPADSPRAASGGFAAAFLPGLLFVLGMTALVEVLARLGLLSSYFPPPTAIAAALGQGLANGDITSQVGMTLSTFAEGLVLASVLA
ncbi:MAG: hypothetical protein QOD51_2367, partial [Candidatus Eremiobacteraeota bacterium]|nr:hypothetical protein [Candidatus Eremiobacteraeota bacterium]